MKNTTIGVLYFTEIKIKNASLRRDQWASLTASVHMETEKRLGALIAHLVNQGWINKRQVTRLIRQRLKGMQPKSRQPKRVMQSLAKTLNRPPFSATMIMDGTNISRQPCHHHHLVMATVLHQATPITIAGGVVIVGPRLKIGCTHSGAAHEV